MSRKRTLRLGQQWPDSTPDNKYWIGADPMSSSIQHDDGLIILGRECVSLEDIENVASEIRADLDKTLAEARDKLGSKKPA
jgi:hypothetical protein